jgi:rRNA maturation RNase YbeY
MISIYFESTPSLVLDLKDYDAWLGEVCNVHKKELGEVSLIFCSDDYLLVINKSHLNHDYYTDIITFEYCENDRIIGDLFISIDRVRENAEIFKVGFINELNRVVAHGVLHLIGFGDKSVNESKQMRLLENDALELLVSRETL